MTALPSAAPPVLARARLAVLVGAVVAMTLAGAVLAAGIVARGVPVETPAPTVTGPFTIGETARTSFGVLGGGVRGPPQGPHGEGARRHDARDLRLCPAGQGAGPGLGDDAQPPARSVPAGRRPILHLVTASRPATAAVAKGPRPRSPRAQGRAGCSLTPRWTRASPSSCRATARTYMSSSARPRRRSRWCSTSGARSGRKVSAAGAVHRRVRPPTEARDDRAHHRPCRRTASRAARPPVGGVPAHAGLRLRDRHVDAGHARRGGRLRALRAAAAPALAARLDAVAAARVHVRVARTRRDAPPRGAPRAGAVRPRARRRRPAPRSPGSPPAWPPRSACHCTPASFPRTTPATSWGSRSTWRGTASSPSPPASPSPCSSRAPSRAASRGRLPSPARGACRCRSPAAWILRTALALVLVAPVALFASPARSWRPPARARARRAPTARPSSGSTSGHRRRHPPQPLRRPRPSGQDVRAAEPGRRRARPGGRARTRSACATTRSSRWSSAPTSGTAWRSLPQQRHRGRLRHPHRRPRLRAESSGDAIGENPSSAVPHGATRTYRYYVPHDQQLEGAHYLRPGPGNREAVSHGLFGTLVVEPPGSTYLDLTTGQPMQSGWEAMIVPGDGAAFREPVIMQHEIGNELYDIPAAQRRVPADGRPAHGGLPARVASDQLPLRAVLQPDGAPPDSKSRPTARTRSATRPRRFRAATSATRRRSGSCTPARRSSTSSTCTAAASAGGRTRNADPSFDYGHRPQQEAQGRHLVAAGLAVDRPGRVVQPRDRERRGRRAAGARRLPLPLPHRAALRRRHVELLARLQHPSARPRAVARSRRPAAGGRLARADRPHDARRHDARGGGPGRLDRAAAADAGRAARTARTPRCGTGAWTRPIPTARCYSASPRRRVVAEPRRACPGPPARRYPGDDIVGDRPEILFDPTTGGPPTRCCVRTSGSGHRSRPTGTRARRSSARTATRARPGTSTRAPAARTASARPARRRATFNVVAIELPIPVTTTGARRPTGKIFVLAKDKQDVLAGNKPTEPLAIRAERRRLRGASR